MHIDKNSIEEIYNHWITTSDKDFETMIHLYSSEDNHWALFLGHIVIEKLLKAAIVKDTNQHAPFTHDLRRLAKLSRIEFKNDHLDWFDTITTFNLNTRYESYKQAFYKKCTYEYTTEWIGIIKVLREWIKGQL